jgi:hypothetical protein
MDLRGADRAQVEVPAVWTLKHICDFAWNAQPRPPPVPKRYFISRNLGAGQEVLPQDWAALDLDLTSGETVSFRAIFDDDESDSSDSDDSDEVPQPKARGGGGGRGPTAERGGGPRGRGRTRVPPTEKARVSKEGDISINSLEVLCLSLNSRSQKWIQRMPVLSR